MIEARPDPDQLLATVKTEEAKARRGKLRIFFGASAGVGKTYSMLEAAHGMRANSKNIVIEYRYAEGKLDHLPQLAGELVEQKPDVIVVGGTSVAVAAKKATSTIPIVVAGAGDLVEAGLIKSFTGVARMSPDFFGARLKLIKEGLPKAAQIASLSNPKTPGHDRRLRDAELGARALGLQFQSVLAKTANELDGAVATAAQAGPDTRTVGPLLEACLSRAVRAYVLHESQLAPGFEHPL